MADLVLISKKTDPLGAEYVEDIIVIDTKLSKSTDLSDNQKASNKLNALKIKSISGELVRGELPINDSFKAGATIPRNGKIRKMYTKDNGEFEVTETE